MWKKVKRIFNCVMELFSADTCYSEMEKEGYAAMGCCGGMVGGDRNTGFLSYSCIGCPHLVLINERRKEMSKKLEADDVKVKGVKVFLMEDK